MSAEQKVNLLGFVPVGNFAQSPSIPVDSSTPESDRKLWIIGAVLGPVFFALLLIGLFGFLHYKCRSRGTNRSTTLVYLHH